MAATAIATGIATDMVRGIANAIIAAVIKQIKDVVELDQSLQLLNTDFSYMNSMLLYIDQQFQAQQRRLPEPIEVCLGRMSNALNEGQQLINRANGQRRRCFGCCLLCNPNLFTQIRDWRTRFDKLFQEFVGVFSITAHTEHIVSSAPPQTELLLQDVPDDIVGSTIDSAQMKLQTWLTEPLPQARVIGIYGMGGVGKTSVLKVIHDNYKKVSGIFEIVIWFTVSKYKPEEENDKIKELQDTIAYTLNVDLKDCPNLDIRKMKLSASLEKKRFLLILDDLWSKMDLVKVGVKFGLDKGSKVLISTRSRDVIKNMEASDYSLRMEPLSQEDGWKLFSRKAFANWAFQEKKDIQIIAEEIAKECKGLPLALNVVAAALSSERDLKKWRDALDFMRNVDPSFPDTHSTIDAELYQRLRWSYNDLSDTLKSCFLYCAAFPEDAEIDVQILVEMWSAEGLLGRRGISSLMDVERQYIDALVGRCLIEYVGVKPIKIPCGNVEKEVIKVHVEKEVIKVHDVLRDTAIYIGERDEHWVFASGQHLQNFPPEEVTRNCKRLSVGHNDIEELPTDLQCTELLSLILANCPKLTKVPAASFLNIMSLKVLDLSCTLITSLPTSVGQLGQLEFLNLTGCYLLNELPETICSLFRLQFLNLDFCESLVSLPDNIGDLKSLKHFSFEIWNDTRSMVIPRSIFGLTSLTKLCLPRWGPGCAISMEDLINLSNLMELSIAVKAHTMSNCDWTWLKMRKLVLRFEYDANARRDAAAKADSNVAVDDGDNVVVKDADGDEDDVVEDAVMLYTLPLENMNELQSLCLIQYRGLSLPNYICKFQNLEELRLVICPELRELPVLENGSDSASDSFPMLKKLDLWELDKLESITNVFNGGAMSKLQYFGFFGCPLPERLPIGIEKLCNLKEISGEKDWWSDIIWEDEATRVKLQPLFRDLHRW